MVAQRLYFLVAVVLILSPIGQAPSNFGITGAQGMCPANTPDDLEHNFRFFDKGKPCDGTFPMQPIDPDAPLSTRGCRQCCKNFLSCIDNANTGPVCTEVYQGMPCDLNQAGSCGGSLTCTQVNTTASLCLLLSAPLENGALCHVHEQCLSGVCNSSGFCSTAEPLEIGDTCESSAQCPPMSWCNSSKQCGAPLPVGSACDLSEPVPNWQCTPGSGCHASATNETQGRCTIYYSGKESSPCDSDESWWNCGYGSVCSNTSNNKFVCTTQPSNPLKTQCSSFPFSEPDFQKCPVGSTCGCFARNKTHSSQCEIYINTNCVLQLSAVYTCMVKNQCPHDPAVLIGGNPSSFAGPAVLGSCIDQHCRNKQAHLINCQNVAIASNLSPAFAPTVGPSAYKEEGSDGLQDWQVGLMIVAAADFTIIIITLSIISLRQAYNF